MISQHQQVNTTNFKPAHKSQLLPSHIIGVFLMYIKIPVCDLLVTVPPAQHQASASSISISISINIKHQASSIKHQASSIKHQASASITYQSVWPKQLGDMLPQNQKGENEFLIYIKDESAVWDIQIRTLTCPNMRSKWWSNCRQIRLYRHDVHMKVIWSLKHVQSDYPASYVQIRWIFLSKVA